LADLRARASKDDGQRGDTMSGRSQFEGGRVASNGAEKTMGAFVYMLRCADGSLYVGSATGDDLSKRVSEHQCGLYGGYTSTRLPVDLIWQEHFDRITDAIAVERQLKGWSRAKKLALARGDWGQLMTFARRRGGRGKR
jgi:putative endonuclease